MEQKEQINTKKRKEIFIESYRLSNNVTKSCKEAQIGRTTYYRWLKHSLFKQELDEAIEGLKDDIENQLIDQALSGDPRNIACLIFVCKTKLRDRGYIEKQDIQHSGDKESPLIIEEHVYNAKGNTKKREK